MSPILNKNSQPDMYTLWYRQQVAKEEQLKAAFDLLQQQFNDLRKLYEAKVQECERLRSALQYVADNHHEGCGEFDCIAARALQP